MLLKKKYHLHIREIIPVCSVMWFDMVHKHVGQERIHT